MTDPAIDLRDKIIEVISRAQFQPGVPNANGKAVTWCNEAADAVEDELGFDMRSILNPKGIGWTGATAMYDNAAAVVKTGKIFEVAGKQAQAWANRGIPVIAIARRQIDDDKHSSHVGIVCPTDDPFSPAAGPYIGQAGAVNGFRSAWDSFQKFGLSAPRYYILPLKTA